jgi:hypothetical protein
VQDEAGPDQPAEAEQKGEQPNDARVCRLVAEHDLKVGKIDLGLLAGRFARMALAGCTADVLHDPHRRRFRVQGFLSHLHSLMVTMSHLDGLRGESSIAELCRREGIAESLYLRREAQELKAVVAEQALELRLLKKA